jgi:hypothetical protein
MKGCDLLEATPLLLFLQVFILNDFECRDRKCSFHASPKRTGESKGLSHGYSSLIKGHESRVKHNI